MKTVSFGCSYPAKVGYASVSSRALATSTLRTLVTLIPICQLLLCPTGMAAQNGPVPVQLKDYVSCQFTLADTQQWKTQESSSFVMKHQAAANALQELPQTKDVKKAQQELLKATTQVGITSAINSIADPNVRAGIISNVNAADTQVPPALSPPSDLLCSRSLLSWREASDILGTRIANTYLVVQVVVRNLNQDSDYLIQDVIIAAPKTSFGSGRDKMLARGVSMVGQSKDPRNQIMSALDTLAATSGAIALIGTQGAMITSNFMNLQNANNVLTAFIPPLKRWFPDFTVDQLNRLNDLSFSASTTYKMLVAKGGSAPFVTFVPQSLFADPVHKWKSAEFVQNENHTYVLVAGVHIQEVPGPSIGSFTPAAGPPGSAVTINGTNFGASQGSGVVKFGSTGVQAVVSSWSPSSIVVTVPSVPVGSEPVVVSAGGKDSPALNFTVNCPAAGPCITNLSPPLGAPGTPVTITGMNLGSTPGTVTFGGMPPITPPAAAWAPTTITVNVPNMAAGPVSVVVTAGGTASPPASFTVNCPAGTAPCITKLSASTVAAATAAGGLTITGSNFGASGSVKFVGAATTVVAAADVTSWSPTSITVNTHAMSSLAGGTENVVVTVGGLDSGPATFTAP